MPRSRAGALATQMAFRALSLCKPARDSVMQMKYKPQPGEADIERVRDATGAIGAVFDRAAIRGVIVRPDRYVAACLGRTSGPAECDRLLQALAATG
ncbi:MAG TPA: hypothetical protein VHQ02_16530 [Usitatibacter sp.]|nr:hypothetical protein [Usitatibacter sp.]